MGPSTPSTWTHCFVVAAAGSHSRLQTVVLYDNRPARKWQDEAGAMGVEYPLVIVFSVGGAWRSLVSALVWGTRGPEFKSRRPDSEKSLHCGGFFV